MSVSDFGQDDFYCVSLQNTRNESTEYECAATMHLETNLDVPASFISCQYLDRDVVALSSIDHPSDVNLVGISECLHTMLLCSFSMFCSHG